MTEIFAVFTKYDMFLMTLLLFWVSNLIMMFVQKGRNKFFVFMSWLLFIAVAITIGFAPNF